MECLLYFESNQTCHFCPTGGAVVVGAGGVGAAVVAGGATVEPKVVVNIN